MNELLKLRIQLFATDEEGQQVEDTAVDTPDTEGAQGGDEVEIEKPQEVEEQGFSISEEEYNKALQSASSKAKHELLKEIGLESVKDIKDLIGKGGQLDALNVELEATRAENLTLNSTIKSINDAKLAQAFEIPEKSQGLFIKLVDELEGDLTREEKAEIIKEQLVGIGGVAQKVGAAKQTDEMRTEAELLAELQKL